MKKSVNLLRHGALVLALIIAPLGHAAEQQAAKVMATVNGKPITQQMLQLYVERRVADHSAAPDAQEHIANLLPDLVTLEVLAQQAVTEGMDKQPAVQTELALQRKDLLAQALLGNYLKAHPPTDKELHQTYELVKARIYPRQYQISQIQVADEAKARDLIAKLKKGADFKTLAAANSTDPTGKKGGALGWYTLDELPPDFSAAVKQLKPGDVAPEPLKSNRGWHVVKVTDVRDNPPPSFEDSRQLLERIVRNRHLQAYVSDLRKRAKISAP